MAEAATLAPGTFKIETEGRNVKITGNGVVRTDRFKLPENWYTRKLTYYGSSQAGLMDYVEATLKNEAGGYVMGFSDRRRGVHVSNDAIHYPESMSEGTTDTFYLETRSPTAGIWVIEYIAPPDESRVVHAPATINGTGPATAEPVRIPLKAGKATITYNGPAELFRVDFLANDMNYKNYSSFFLPIDIYIDNIVGGQYATSHTWTVDLNTYEPGVMVMADINGPAGGSWSITISPA